MHEQKQPLSEVKLLVAEDDPVIAMDYAAMLSSAGAEIVGSAQTSGGSGRAAGFRSANI